MATYQIGSSGSSNLLQVTWTLRQLEYHRRTCVLRTVLMQMLAPRRV